MIHRLIETAYVWANDNLSEMPGNAVARLYWAVPEWVYWISAAAVTVVGLAVAAVLQRRTA